MDQRQGTICLMADNEEPLHLNQTPNDPEKLARARDLRARLLTGYDMIHETQVKILKEQSETQKAKHQKRLNSLNTFAKSENYLVNLLTTDVVNKVISTTPHTNSE